MEELKIAEYLKKNSEYIQKLPEELQEKAKGAKSLEDLKALTAEIEGELPDELAEAVAGGKGDDRPKTKYQYPCYVRCNKTISENYNFTKAGAEAYAVLGSDWNVYLLEPKGDHAGAVVPAGSEDNLIFLRKA